MTAADHRPRTRQEPPLGSGRRSRLPDRLVVRLLRSDLRPLLDARLCALRYTSHSGAQVVLPVQFADGCDGIVVYAANADRKRWWRHFVAPAIVDVWHDGRWVTGAGTVRVGSGSAAAAAYRRAYPVLALPDDATFVVVTFPEPPPRPTSLRGRPLARLWFRVVTMAEAVGFAVPACVGALTANAGPAIVVPALLAAGAVEGTALGWGQATVLGRALPELSRHRWIAATAAAAVAAYLMGLVPSTVGPSLSDWPPVLLGIAGALLGCGLLASIGTAQWLVLRRHVSGAWRWIAATAAAWAVGLGVFLGFTMPRWQPGQHPGLTVVIGVVGGVLMAATTSAITGTALRRFLAAHR